MSASCLAERPAGSNLKGLGRSRGFRLVGLGFRVEGVGFRVYVGCTV